MYKEIFAQRIKKARELTGFTQREVEQETKVKQSKIAKIENGRQEPDLETLGILSDFYQVSIDWMLGTNPKNRTI